MAVQYNNSFIGYITKHEVTISKIAIIAIFLAMIRCTIEHVRLGLSIPDLSIAQAQPFLLGSIVSFISTFIMLILFSFKKHKLILITSITTIIILLIVKYPTSVFMPLLSR